MAETHKIALRLVVFRNPTRFNPPPFATLANDRDGCSTQLLAQQFDMINPDPYPVWRTGDSQSTNSDRDPRAGYIASIIPLENAYWSGLVRRFRKKLVPWMQAHTFSHDLQFYAERSLEDWERRHLYDRFLTEPILTGLTIDLDTPYDVFEYYKREDLDCRELRGYRRVILCITDLEGLPLYELRRQSTPLAIVCWNASSLTAHPEFSGITELRQLPGELVGITEPAFTGGCSPREFQWNNGVEKQSRCNRAIRCYNSRRYSLRRGTSVCCNLYCQGGWPMLCLAVPEYRFLEFSPQGSVR